MILYTEDDKQIWFSKLCYLIFIATIKYNQKGSSQKKKVEL